ncbi:YbaB/EbfC family nucleoid-associated protein [Rubellimicrobium roseum]|uniref:Nucleoid-associated protein FHG71_02505 n=1 Tax=Rubellimicrobium roseum TaxID=687525 RepID=A0A5C4NH55_9RHOB|nr:YbaB/EbfC family nucleoid-associated protein [Rubellimicrobium roseum]TNC74091.1 YbaB/EbfC family nucleoid-associated protein [Rubellimicrobium roseum]
MLKGLGLGGLGDMAKMMKAAQEMQGKMAEMQASLDTITVDGQAGAGLVTVTATAKGDLKSLSIDPSIFRAEDREMVEDLILAAIKDAQARAADRVNQEMQRISEELGLPPGMKMPF